AWRAEDERVAVAIESAPGRSRTRAHQHRRYATPLRQPGSCRPSSSSKPLDGRERRSPNHRAFDSFTDSARPKHSHAALRPRDPSPKTSPPPPHPRGTPQTAPPPIKLAMNCQQGTGECSLPPPPWQPQPPDDPAFVPPVPPPAIPPAPPLPPDLPSIPASAIA